MTFLAVAALLNFAAAGVHLSIILGGPPWYRFFGAGERLALLAEHGHPWPALVTSFITLVLAAWGFYALALAGLIAPLPAMEPVVWAITGVYALRGLLPLLLAPALPSCRTPFMVGTSIICLLVALVHGLGVLGR